MDYREKLITLKDEEIIVEIKKGKKEYFEILIIRYKDKLARYAKKFLLDKFDTDDLIQDVFIKSYINLESFDESRRFSPWIYRIAHNEFLNKVKKKLTEKLLPIDFDTFFPHPEAKERSDKSTEDFLNENILNSYLEKLDAKYREILVLYFYEDMDYKDIAEVLSIPVSTVGVRISRAKEKLKLLIKDKIHE
jgi:RNA polymerase sigma-70 factor (ECF subfamily)